MTFAAASAITYNLAADNFRGLSSLAKGAGKAAKKAGKGTLAVVKSIGRKVGIVGKGATKAIAKTMKGAQKILGPVAVAFTAYEVGSTITNNKLSRSEKWKKILGTAGALGAFAAGASIGAAVGGPLAPVTGLLGGLVASYWVDS